jgi:PAS domain S-box-containing protein
MLNERLSLGLTPEQENDYRQTSLPIDVKQARIGTLLILVPILIYVFSDYQFFGNSLEFYALAAMRASLAIYGWWLLSYLARVRDRLSYDRSVTAWLAVAIVVNLAINFTRPENYVVHVIVVAVFVFIIYLVIPNRLANQVVLTSALTAGEFLLIFFMTRPSMLILVPVLFSLIFTCFIAFTSSWQLHYQRRKGFIEISDRKKAEDALKEEKDRLLSLLNSISDEVWFADLKGNFVLTNPSAAKEFGLKPESNNVAVKKMAASLEFFGIDGSPRPVEEAPTLRALKGETVKNQIELVRTPARGELRYRQVNASPVRDANGHIIGSVSIVQDITESKRAEKEGETTIEFLRLVNESHTTKDLVKAATAFFQQQAGCEAVGIRIREKGDYPFYETKGFSPEFVQSESGLCSFDEHGERLLDVNGIPILDCMCGYVIRGRFDRTRPFFTAKGSFWTNSTSQLLASISEEDRKPWTRDRCNEEGYESVALIALRVGDETIGLLQLNDRRRDLYSMEAIEQWERLADYLAVALAKFRTEEELKESRNEFESLFSFSNEGIALHQMVYDQGGKAVDYRILKVNGAFERTTGISKELAVGSLASKLYGTGEAPFLDVYERVVRTGEPASFDVFFEPMGKNLRISAFSPVKDQFASIFIDISALKGLESKLQDRAEELARSNAELQQFAYVASHDLQEPLRMVISYLSLLERKYGNALDSDAKEYIDFAVSGGRRMKTLIDDLLEYSRVETRVQPSSPVDMNRVALETEMILDYKIKESGAEITLDQLPTVTGDALQLGQVMQNLLANALKFTKPFVRPIIHIGCSQEGDRWVFFVQDNGIGLKEEYAERIFQMFQRLHTQGKYEGTGVGLAIVKKIVERHGGRVWVESEEGVGSTFFFTIPKAGK